MDLRFPLRSAFLAIPLGDAAVTLFGELQDRLRDYVDILSFQKRGSPHLTLQFWKELMEIEYGQIVHQCETVARQTTPFPLKIEGTGSFGRKGETHVLYLDVPFNEPLARLKKRCPWPSTPIDGAPPGEERLFRPHVTLARVTHPQRFRIVEKEVLKTLKDISFTMSVDRLRLYANVGAVSQTPLRDFVLAGR